MSSPTHSVIESERHRRIVLDISDGSDAEASELSEVDEVSGLFGDVVVLDVDRNYPGLRSIFNF
jgi:hypothetical protein